MQPPTGPVTPWCICFHPAPEGPGGKTTSVRRTGERDYFPLAPEGPGEETIRERLAAGNNGAFWVKKIERNMGRDRRNEADLEAMGWTVMRVWGFSCRGMLLRQHDWCCSRWSRLSLS